MIGKWRNSDFFIWRRIGFGGADRSPKEKKEKKKH
jgi:hypothetical protein